MSLGIEGGLRPVLQPPIPDALIRPSLIVTACPARAASAFSGCPSSNRMTDGRDLEPSDQVRTIALPGENQEKGEIRRKIDAVLALKKVERSRRKAIVDDVHVSGGGVGEHGVELPLAALQLSRRGASRHRNQCVDAGAREQEAERDEGIALSIGGNAWRYRMCRLMLHDEVAGARCNDRVRVVGARLVRNNRERTSPLGNGIGRLRPLGDVSGNQRHVVVPMSMWGDYRPGDSVNRWSNPASSSERNRRCRILFRRWHVSRRPSEHGPHDSGHMTGPVSPRRVSLQVVRHEE